MSIHVICPGCMRQFEVSDRFAGKKGPCPKCGHIIEIPKGNVVVHAPDEIIVEGRKVKNPDFVQPIERAPFAFTRRQIILNVIGAILVISFAVLFSNIDREQPIKWIAGALGTFVVAFPLARYGYILIRNPDDLEIFLGGELHRKSFLVALGYSFAWFLFEGLMIYMNPGFFFFLYLVPIAILAAFIPLVVFDIDYGNSFMLFTLFVLLMILLSGLMFRPCGWVWSDVPPRIRESNPIPVVIAPDTTDKTVPKATEKSKLSSTAPDPSKLLDK